MKRKCMSNERRKERCYEKKREEQQKTAQVNNSKLLDLEYDNVELTKPETKIDQAELNKPEMKNEPFERKVTTIEKNPTETILIKKQSKDETVEIFSGVKSSVLQTLNDIVQNYLPIPQDKKPFDPEEFYERLKRDTKYPINISWIR